jgi:integrase
MANAGASRLALIDAKTGPREVPLPPEAVAVLRARRPRRATGYVFPSPMDPQRPRRQIDDAWAKVKAEAGLRPSTRLHDLRHTYASRALMQGETMQMAGKLLGHKRTSTTERYAHLEDSFLAAAADRVAARVAKLLG